MTSDLEAELRGARRAVMEADRAWQFAWGAGDPRGIREAELAYDRAYARLAVLVRRKLALRGHR